MSGAGFAFFDEGGSSGMMVEFEKQVHLQKVVGAEGMVNNGT